MRYLKQSTSIDVAIGPFLDDTDGKTAETALTITQPDIRLKKNAAAWAQKAAAQTLTHEEAGWYEVTLDTTDTDTIGILMVAVHESGALPVWLEFHVLAANVYDSLFGAATDKLDVNVEEWNTTSVPAEHTAGYPIVTVKDGTGTGEINTNAGAIALVDLVTTATTLTNLPAITANWLTASGLATDAVEEIRNAITGGAYDLDTDANGRIRIVDGSGTGEILTTSGAIDSVTTTGTVSGNVVGSVGSVLGSVGSVTGSVGSVTGSVGSVTGSVGGNVTGTVGGFTTAAKAEIQTEVEDGIVVHRLDELLNADSDIDGAAPPTVGSVFHELMSKTAGSFTFDQTTDSCEAIRDRGDAAWITATGFSTHSAADVWAVVTRTITGLAADSITASAIAADAVAEIRLAITGGAYALDTDGNGRVRIVDGTGTGELATTGGAIDSVLALGATALASVNAEVVDALNTDTYAEPSQGAPPSSNSLVGMSRYLYVAFRNKKTVTATETKIFADDLTAVLFKQTLSDDGTTLTVGEFATGA